MKSFIDLDQTKKDKGLDYLMIFRNPCAPGSDRAMHYAARRKSSASARWDCAPARCRRADFFRAIEIGERARNSRRAASAPSRISPAPGEPIFSRVISSKGKRLRQAVSCSSCVHKLAYQGYD